MKRILKGVVTTGLTVSILATGGFKSNALVISNSSESEIVAVKSEIDGLIEEKKNIIEKKKFSKNSAEQKALGKRIGEIERKISNLKRWESISNTSQDKDISSRINKLIEEKRQVIERKKVSRDGGEQKQLGIRIGEIEREISDLKKSNSSKPQWVEDRIKYYKSHGKNYKGQADINKSEIIFNKKQNDVTAYKFNGNNYFKLRDMAKLSKGTDHKFNVTWNEEKKAINIKDKTEYQPVGGELDKLESGKKDVIENTSKIYLNDEVVELESYTIDGNNYFKLRDLADLLGFHVDWDEDSKRVIINM